MTIKSLLFLLFLYICLVWVGALYLHPWPELREFGLRWTGVGLLAVFVMIVGSHILSWWRQWRARPRPSRKPSAKAAPIVHEDDAALVAAIAEANAALTKAPGYRGQREPIYRLPWRLLIGPEGGGKTSTFLNSDIASKLLSGNASETGTSPSTRLCNLWLANNTIFIEIAGRAFDGDLSRWTQLLRVLRGPESVPLWRRLLGKPEKTIMLRGVIGFCELREFTAASADPQRFERFCRHWHDRLMAIGEVFDVRFPVYEVITKCDGIPYFQEFFHQLPESDTRQVLGCTLYNSQAVSAGPEEAFAEVESRRLTKAFRALYQSLAERRLTHLAYENNPALCPAIYEFPRELKRIRGSVVQFLIDAFRPDPLRPSPLLRGYFFTAIREVEMNASPAVTSPEDWQTIVSRPSYAVAATQMFRTDTSVPSIGKGRSIRMTRRWAFVSDLFNRVVLADQPLQTAPRVDARFELYRRKAFAVVLGGCILLCLAFFVSWFGNQGLLTDVEDAAIPGKAGAALTLAELHKLDALRVQVERLRSGGEWWLHSGLYAGNRVMESARTSYFRRFQPLVLHDLSRAMASSLKTLPIGAAAGNYEPVYRALKTHLTISSGVCPVEPEVVSQALKEVRGETEADIPNESEWQKLLNLQIDFYAQELINGNPIPVSEDTAAVARGREYLKNIGSVERTYNAILSNARKSLAKAKGLAELAPNYSRVMKGQSEPPSGFTLEGWDFIVEASKNEKSALLSDCVFGDTQQAGGDQETGTTKELDLTPEITRLYVRDYLRAWHDFLKGYSVLPYGSPADAAEKLAILSSNRSPLLVLFALSANQTTFPSEESVLQKGVETILEKAEKVAGIGKRPKTATDPTGTPAQITQFFQPVHEVVPPSSEIFANSKDAAAYLEALARLRAAMQTVAASGTNAQAQQAASEAALPIYNDGLAIVDQMARVFKPNDLDQVVQRLLKEPIERAKPFIKTDLDRIIAAEINGKRNQICSSVAGTFDKYPFRRSSTQEASLNEFSTWFAPATGEIWKFQSGPLGPFTQFENGLWKAKDPSQKPQVTAEMLAFLNRAQSIKDAFYPKDSNQPQFTYSLRPVLDNTTRAIVQFELDGQAHQFNNVFQKQFSWPAAPGARPGAIARIQGDITAAFLSYAGPWGIFRMMDEAEPRAAGDHTLIWKYSTAGGQRDPLSVPVQMNFPEFPNGIDVFHPQFFAGVRCPAVAVR